MRDLEQVAEDVVLQEPAVVRHRRPELGDRSSVHASSAHPLSSSPRGRGPGRQLA